MIYFFQTLSLKTRFLGVLVSFLFVLGFWWLLTGAPWSLAHLKGLGHGAGLPDFGWWTAPRVLQDLLDRWGDDGKSLYVTVLAPTSAGFWAALGVFLAAVTLYLLKKSNPSARWYLLPVLPLLATICGFLECAAVVVTALLPALESDTAALAASILGSARWWLFALSFAVVGLGSLIGFVRKAIDRTKETLANHRR